MKTQPVDQDYVTAVHVQSEVNKAVEKAVDKVTKEKDAEINKAAKTKGYLFADRPL